MRQTAQESAILYNEILIFIQQGKSTREVMAQFSLNENNALYRLTSLYILGLLTRSNRKIGKYTSWVFTSNEDAIFSTKEKPAKRVRTTYKVKDKPIKGAKKHSCNDHHSSPVFYYNNPWDGYSSFSTASAFGSDLS